MKNELVAAVAMFAVVPFALLVATSFVKFSVVLGILRSAFGGAAVPPAAVAFVLSVVFALFVAAPVIEQITAKVGAATDPVQTLSAAGSAAAPVKEFLQKHTPARERQSFFELQQQLRSQPQRGSVNADDLVVLAPAFLAAELKAAFQIGFLLFLPFLIIELVVSSILTSVGMNALSPAAISLPFKLLLFVLADGWHLLLRGIAQSYT